MRVPRHVALPLAAGLAVAAVTFAVVLLATRGDDRPATRTQTPAAASADQADPAAGRLVFAELGCGSCHTLAAAGSKGQIGPSLDQALPRHTRASLRAKIVRPGAGSVMPGDFAERTSFQELQALVDFLIAARDGGR
jgi:mono/diheme cytochrome c family protein